MAYVTFFCAWLWNFRFLCDIHVAWFSIQIEKRSTSLFLYCGLRACFPILFQLFFSMLRPLLKRNDDRKDRKSVV